MIQLSISSNGRKVGNKPGANDFVSTEIPYRGSCHELAASQLSTLGLKDESDAFLSDFGLLHFVFMRF